MTVLEELVALLRKAADHNRNDVVGPSPDISQLKGKRQGICYGTS